MTTALGSEFVVDETAHINVARWVCLFTVVSVTPALLLVSGVDFSTHLEPLMPGHLDTLSAEALDVLANAALRGNYIHTLLEWTAATSAIFIFALALGKYRLDRQSSLLVIGVALVCAGAMDAFHTLAANGLISSAAASQHLVPFTWTICRMFHSCIQLAGVGIAVFAFRRTSKPLGIPALLLISGAFILLAYSIVAYCANSASLPQTMFPDNIVKRPFDLLPLLPNLILGFVLYPIFIRQRRNVFGYMLALALIPDTAAQLYIAFGSGALHDSAFNIAHGLKALSYLVPATGLFIDYVWTYRSLEGATARFRSQRSDLQAAMSRAEAASEAKSSFLAHMSHEIRTPLTGIVGYADLLERSAGDPADRAAWTRQLQRNSQHLLSLVNDILDLSKIEADEMAIHLGRHSIVDIIEDVASLMSPQADEKLLNFDLSFRGAMPVEIETDPVRIRQILINLSSNAIKFTDSGSIGLGARSISDPESKRTRLEIWVKDTGIGIAPEFHSEIFSAFSQVDRDSGLPSGGTGLGLGISSRIADMLGGEVRVESALGMGSTFTLSLDLGPTADIPFDRPPRRQPVLRAAPENPVEVHLDRAR
ncbi:MAG: ATP-binding protein, partial [Myxococcota bacterium]